MHNDTFIPAAFSLREEVLAFAAREYHTKPEYPWAKSPGYAVLRHTDNRKWYGVIMEVPRKRLGIDADCADLQASVDVDILNVKCAPVLSGSLRMQPGILPAYHMNKENWISILLDGTVDVKQIFTLLDMSFELTAKKSGSKASTVHNTNWIIPANPKYYDIETALTENPDEPFFWKQSNNIFVGDIVYIYLTAPVSSLLFKCRALEVDIPRQSENKNIRMKRAMRLKLLETYPRGAIGRDKLKEHGIYAVRGARSMPKTLIAEIDHMANGTQER